MSNFIINKDGKDILSIDIEVFISKIDNRDIMNEVNDEIYSLAFALMLCFLIEMKRSLKNMIFIRG
ncbi:hypothetical protein LGL08_19510 [Clostridium estertheticum]|uniref:hypothetical protein n=1 Tax=Clostridium estertheticum TaxID=238834 RepID=UPI001CF16DCF|nr:hypothetical protein [Clostridium estertheticum]MCB2308730.1 hypothetical protein [Clostridium estertheticum]MCB2347459.1 hypothetical protein [Clostridium estertheticum]MCB2351716.1 hypothetical protein [Clostridium estertheticum]WAG46295.1 hypothetical protein LL127_01650 [Clostridium estertheticum]